MSEVYRESAEVIDSRRGLGLKGYLFLGILFVVLLFFVGVLVKKGSIRKQITTELAALKQQGEPTRYEELALAYGQVASEKNAGDLLQGAFAFKPPGISEKMDKLLKSYRKADGMLTAAAREELEEAVLASEKWLAALEQATTLEQAVFPLNFSGGLTMLVPHLTQMKSSGQILAGRAILRIENGRKEEALADVHRIFQLARFMEPEPLLISQLVRFSVCELGLVTIESALQKLELNEDELKSLQERAFACQKREPFTRGLIGERVFGIEFLLHPERQLGVAGASVGAVRLIKSSGLIDYEHKMYLAVMKQFIDASRAPFPEALKQDRGLEELLIDAGRDQHRLIPLPRGGFFMSMLLPSISNTLKKQAALVANARVAATALELVKARRLTSEYPQKLADVAEQLPKEQTIDPFTGEEFHYIVAKERFMLYSVGPDGHDNGGKRRGKSGEAYDLVFRVGRVANSEEAN